MYRIPCIFIYIHIGKLILSLASDQKVLSLRVKVRQTIISDCGRLTWYNGIQKVAYEYRVAK